VLCCGCTRADAPVLVAVGAACCGGWVVPDSTRPTCRSCWARCRARSGRASTSTSKPSTGRPTSATRTCRACGNHVLKGADPRTNNCSRRGAPGGRRGPRLLVLLPTHGLAQNSHCRGLAIDVSLCHCLGHPAVPPPFAPLIHCLLGAPGPSFNAAHGAPPGLGPALPWGLEDASPWGWEDASPELARLVSPHAALFPTPASTTMEEDSTPAPWWGVVCWMLMYGTVPL